MRLHFVHNIILFLIWVYIGLDNSLNINVLSDVNANQIAENYFVILKTKIFSYREQLRDYWLEL